EDVKFRRRAVEILLARIWRVKKLALLPDRLPFWLDLVEWIWFAALAAHRINNHESRKTGKENGIGVGHTQRAQNGRDSTNSRAGIHGARFIAASRDSRNPGKRKIKIGRASCKE